MKSIYKLLPILLALFMALSSYTLISEKLKNQSLYNGYIKEAESYYNDGIIVDAVSSLDIANEMNPTIELLLKEGEYFQSAGFRSDATRIAEALLESYPNDKKSYDYALKCYFDYKMYIDCYEVLDTAQKRRISSDIIKSISEQIKYYYNINYYDVEQIVSWKSPYYVFFEEGYYGYCYGSGKTAISNRYLSAGPFVDSIAPITDSDNKTYYIDENGNKKLNIPSELKCEKAGPIINNVAVLLCDGKYGFYDGEFKHKFGSYDYASVMNDGVAAVKEGDSWYLINDSGKKISEKAYADIKLDCLEIVNSNDVIFAKEGQKYIMLNSKGKQIGNSQYDDVDCFANGDYTAVKIGDKWGFIDKEGKVFIKPQYEEAKAFSNGIAAIKMNGKWGYIDTNNKIVIECIFDDCLYMDSSGNAFVKRPEDENYYVLQLLSKNH